MNKKQIIGIGITGLVGSRITELLSDKYEFINLSYETGIDISKKETLDVIKDYKDANYVLHLAAKADVDGCEADKELGEEGPAWKINVIGTQNVSDYCRDLGKKIIYISTDFAFDGTLPAGEKYSEEDIPNPVNWYAKTKYEGEKVIEKSGADYAIARIAYPYRAKFELRKDFFRAILDNLKVGKEIRGVTDHIFTPTFIDDIAYGLDKLIENDAKGIYHLVGSEALTPYEAAIKIAEVFDLDKSLILKTTREEYFAGKAKRPFNVALKNDKIKQLGVEMKGFAEGLLEVKSQQKNQ